MKCQKCGINNANVSYTRILNGEKTELHLCSECARKMNINVNINLGIEDMFSNFFDDFSKIRSLALPSFSSFGDSFNGLIDENIYDSIPFFKNDFFFDHRMIEPQKDELDDILNGIQKKHKNGGTENLKKEEHKENKKGNISKKQDEINQLKAKLQEYIKLEEYEKAAVIRDKIKELEK